MGQPGSRITILPGFRGYCTYVKDPNYKPAPAATGTHNCEWKLCYDKCFHRHVWAGMAGPEMLIIFFSCINVPRKKEVKEIKKINRFTLQLECNLLSTSLGRCVSSTAENLRWQFQQAA